MTAKTADLVTRLRDPNEADGYAQDMIIRREAADEIERLERERSEWTGIAATRNRNIALIADERDRLQLGLRVLRHHIDTYCDDCRDSIGMIDDLLRPAVDVPAVRECGCVMICKREKLKPGERCANDPKPAEPT